MRTNKSTTAPTGTQTRLSHDFGAAHGHLLECIQFVSNQSFKHLQHLSRSTGSHEGVHLCAKDHSPQSPDSPPNPSQDKLNQAPASLPAKLEPFRWGGVGRGLSYFFSRGQALLGACPNLSFFCPSLHFSYLFLLYFI